MTTHESCNEKFWLCPPVYFIPHVGANYEEGLQDGIKVLLLAESHYMSDSEIAQHGRKWTLECFKDYSDEEKSLEGESTFFKRLGTLPTLCESPSGKDIAAAWRRVAFSNYIQKPVGASAKNRPSSDQWGVAESALKAIADRLKPDVILVMAKSVWNDIKMGEYTSDPSIVALKGPERRIWRFPHAGGSALMTWVYHPSWNLETQASRIGVLKVLIQRAENRRNKSDAPIGTDHLVLGSIA